MSEKIAKSVWVIGVRVREDAVPVEIIQHSAIDWDSGRAMPLPTVDNILVLDNDERVPAWKKQQLKRLSGVQIKTLRTPGAIISALREHLGLSVAASGKDATDNAPSGHVQEASPVPVLPRPELPKSITLLESKRIWVLGVVWNRVPGWIQDDDSHYIFVQNNDTAKNPAIPAQASVVGLVLNSLQGEQEMNYTAEAQRLGLQVLTFNDTIAFVQWATKVVFVEESADVDREDLSNEETEPEPTQPGPIFLLKKPKHPVVEEVILVRCDEITRFVGQPRKYFNPERIKRLGRSMLKNGQKIPIIVRPDPQATTGFELVDGERRWKAAQGVGIAELKAIVREVPNKAHQFRDSAISNCGREDPDCMEVALALSKVKRDFDLTIVELADSFTYGTSWVSQHLSLLKMHEEVQAMIDPELPEEEQIIFSVALEIGKVRLERQVEAANYIRTNKLTLPEVRHYIRRLVLTDGASSPRRARKPHDDYKVLLGFLNHSLMKTEQLLDIPGRTIGDLFKNRPSGDATQAAARISSVIERLEEIRKSIQLTITPQTSGEKRQLKVVAV